MATLKEKIHHLDDMLKSQQRKVRHMIEQVRAHTLAPHQSPCCSAASDLTYRTCVCVCVCE